MRNIILAGLLALLSVHCNGCYGAPVDNDNVTEAANTNGTAVVTTDVDTMVTDKDGVSVAMDITTEKEHAEGIMTTEESDVTMVTTDGVTGDDSAQTTSPAAHHNLTTDDDQPSGSPVPSDTNTTAPRLEPQTTVAIETTRDVTEGQDTTVTMTTTTTTTHSNGGSRASADWSKEDVKNKLRNQGKQNGHNDRPIGNIINDAQKTSPTETEVEDHIKAIISEVEVDVFQPEEKNYEPIAAHHIYNKNSRVDDIGSYKPTEDKKKMENEVLENPNKLRETKDQQKQALAWELQQYMNGFSADKLGG